jgi:hypothetical protein
VRKHSSGPASVSKVNCHISAPDVQTQSTAILLDILIGPHAARGQERFCTPLAIRTRSTQQPDVPTTVVFSTSWYMHAVQVENYKYWG